VFNTRVNVYFRATVSAVSCLVVPVFIFIDALYSRALKLNDDDDDDDDDELNKAFHSIYRVTLYRNILRNLKLKKNS